MGSIIEYYDFFIAVFAASIVWPAVFFSWASPAVAYGLSLTSFGILYFTRPIGAYIFGHFGDRLGRRSLVLWTLSIMGIGVVGVGLDPSYGSIGFSSVALLFFFRGLFGLGLGGEFGGAASWLVEASQKSRWRAFWAIWSAPSQIGYALASFNFAILAAIYGKGFFQVGWRIPFLVGGLLIIVGIVIRYRLTESPLFQTLKQRNDVKKNPANYALKKRWRQILLLSGILMVVLLPSGVLQASYGIIYLRTIGVSTSFITFSIGIAAAIGAIFLVLSALSGERFGRRRALMLVSIVTIVSVIIYLPLLDSMNSGLIILAQCLLQATSAASLALCAAFLAEYFPTSYRYSASGLSFQLGGLYYGIVVTFIEPVVLATIGIKESASFIVVIILVGIVISLMCIGTAKETQGERMAA